LRELKEEVGMDPGGVVVRTGIDPVCYKNEKPLFNTCVNVCLFSAESPKETPIIYQTFQNTIRCVSVSNEILHARWASIDDASFMLPQNLYRLLYEFHINTI
jgi:8-oxo-dGTP pyrophosphatase MutT (NUDIX family)